ncbi:hypothetical protein PILCRDRAFT_522285 [Piloderma croceum F 1598]|uniref:Uncharacterized protein n=1 Tax=Piloderma croceum (strain F 1598) TaxID=765440 RepID=A0A0C3FNV3_PILCF|nr:hypothetical protein PILCRDRAFT_522285 [Piloderma croceum F 1598]
MRICIYMELEFKSTDTDQLGQPWDANDHGNDRRQREETRIRQNGTGKYTVRSVERESVANNGRSL